MGNIFKIIDNFIIKILKFLTCLILASMVIVVFCNVIFRYFLNASIAWSEEVSRMLFIWLVFLGAIIAYVTNEHLGLDIIIKLFPKKITQILVIITNLLVFTTLIIILIGGIKMTADSFASGWVASAIPIPYGYIYLVVPFSATLLLLQTLIKSVKDINSLISLIKEEK